MAGFYSDNVYADDCFVNWQATIDNGVSSYETDIGAALPHGAQKAMLSSRGATPSWWGPMTASIIHNDSLLNGRGQPLSKCPSYDVVRDYGNYSGYKTPTCYNSSLEPAFDKTSRSCTSVTEMDMFGYTGFPGSWQQNYIGVNDLAQIYVPTRMPAETGKNNCSRGMEDSTSYAKYGPSQIYF